MIDVKSILLLVVNVALPSAIVNVLDGEEVTAVISPLVVVIVILFPLYIRHVLSDHQRPQ